jgi:hypothetical protein
MRVRPRGSLSPDKMKLVEIAGSQIAKFVQMHWKESEWETAWTYTPPVRIQVSTTAWSRCELNQ